MDRLKNFINGKLVEPRSGRYSQIVNPATGTAYIEAPLSDADDVDDAVLAAAEAFKSWRLTTPGERSLMLFRAADALEAHAEELSAAESENTGKPLRVMRDDEFPAIPEHLRFYAAAARDFRGLATGSYVTGYDSSVRREPIGVCGQVAPWNYPLNMGVWKFGPAIAAGNTVVLKPSDTTPVTTVMAAEIIGSILPPGVLNVVVGDRDTGRALVSHPVPRLVSVTGSERAGIEVSGAAAADLKQVSLELGGKAPVLIFGDVDIKETAADVASAAFFNAGQDCEAATRILVSSDIYDDFVAELVQRANGFSYGPPDQEVFFGPLNSEQHLNKVEGFMDRLPAHASILAGGKADRINGGYFFQPTVVADVKQNDEIVQEEVFGPVCTVQSFDSEDEALTMANDVRFGLAASVWTKDHSRIIRLSSGLDFGKVWVNCHLTVAPEMPNNGYKSSGHGNDLSTMAIEEYTRVKHIMSSIKTV